MAKNSDLKNEVRGLIEKNAEIELRKLFENENILNELKHLRYFNPYVYAIKANHLNFIKVLHNYGFMLQQEHESSEEATSKKFKHNTDDDVGFDESRVEEIEVGNRRITHNHQYPNPVIEAIKCENLNAIQSLIELNINLNPFNYTVKHIPLQIAYNQYQKSKSCQSLKSDESCYSIIKLLLDNNANPNIYNNDGLRLIHQIVLDKNYSLLELLLSVPSCNVNVLTYGKMQNALHLISETRSSKASVVRNYSIQNSETNEVDKKMAKLLIKHKCNLNHRDYNSHETPIFKAVLNNNYDLVKIFLSEGIDVTLKNVFGNDVLSRSVQLSHYKIARLLIRLNSPINSSTCIYKTPKSKDTSSTTHGISNNDETVNGENNLFMKSLNNYEEFLEFLKRYTHDCPRTLKDLSRLCVRNLMRKPVSNHVDELNLPKTLNDFILLHDIE